jgi:hypothetical protein
MTLSLPAAQVLFSQTAEGTGLSEHHLAELMTPNASLQIAYYISKNDAVMASDLAIAMITEATARNACAVELTTFSAVVPRRKRNNEERRIAMALSDKHSAAIKGLKRLIPSLPMMKEHEKTLKSTSKLKNVS